MLHGDPTTNDTISDDTMADIPSVILTDHDGEQSMDLFDETVIHSTQINGARDRNVPAVPLSPIHEPQDKEKEKEKPKICYEGCKHQGPKSRKSTVQCHMCQHWAHPQCVGEQDKDIVGIWTCPSCRKTPDILNSMFNLLVNVQRENQQFKATITTQLDELHNTIRKKDGQITKLTNEVKTTSDQHIETMKQLSGLQTRVADLTVKLNEQLWKDYRNQSEEKSLVIGSSIVRDICQSQLDNTDVICIRGGKISDITKAVSAKPSDVYDHITLVTGGNDCDPKEPSTAQNPSTIVENYRNLVKLSRSKSKYVTVSSICPRIKSDDVKAQIDSVNAGLQVMCGDEEVSFVDNTPTFHLADGNINDGYFLADGIHPTYKATEKLAKNLKLRLKKGSKSVCQQRQANQERRNDPPKERRNDPPSGSDHTGGDIDPSQTFWANTIRKVSQSQTRQNKNHKDSQTSYRSSNNQQSANNQSTTDQTRCYNCYETNHTLRTCRHERPLICKTCGQEGHKSKHHVY